MRGAIHALIVETPDARIIVDTCIGNDKARAVPAWNQLQTQFLQDIASAGYPKESIDTVLCTHLHVDHVGWNTMWDAGKWVPTFPNAEYLFARREWEYWSANEQDEFGPVVQDSVRPIVDADLATLVDMDHKLTSEVCLEPTPGPTPRPTADPTPWPMPRRTSRPTPRHSAAQYTQCKIHPLGTCYVCRVY